MLPVFVSKHSQVIHTHIIYNTAMSPKQIRIVAIVVVLLLGGWLAYWLLNPHVVEFSPPNGVVEQGRDSAIEITFSHTMQADTVLKRLSISPLVKGSYTWEGATLRYQPEEDWPAGSKVRITLVSGALTKLGIPLGKAYAWSFTVRPTRLAYLYPAKGSADLYLLDPESGEQRQLTQSGGLLDFDHLPGQDLIIFSAANQTEGSDIYQVFIDSGETTQLLDCGHDACSMVRISPDGSWLAYERSGPSGVAAVWLLDLESGEQQQISPTGEEVRLPQWSPQGLLSYYDSDDESYHITDLKTGQTVTLDNQSGEYGTWSPNGQRFVVQQLTPYTFELPVDLIDKPFQTPEPEEGYEPVEVASGNIVAFNYAARTTVNLSGEMNVEDAGPVFSPDGRWLAFARRVLEQSASTLGRQLWLMRQDGSQQHALTDSPNHKYSAFAWHPEGQQLAMVRVDSTRPADPPELWLIDIRNNQQIRLVIGGYAPLWIP